MNSLNSPYKSLRLFHLAAISLLCCGISLAANQSMYTNATLIWCCFCGVFAIYRLNDFIDNAANLKNNLAHFFNNKLNLVFTLQFVLLTLPLAFIYLSWTTWLTLALSGLIGALYSIKFHFGNTVFRIKNTFLVKNITIGLSWGSLILIGAGNLSSPIVKSMVLFAIVQVLIGSVIRDIPDRDKDRTHKVQSLPIVLGINKTILLLHILNVLSLGAALLSVSSKNLWLTFSCVILWRLVTLSQIKRTFYSVFWSQKANLFTCTLLFIVFYLTTFRYAI